MNWLNGISITCFAASYLVVFGLELSRLYFRAPIREILSLTMLVAGLFAHAVFIFLQTGADGLVMGSWSGWILAAAWILIGGVFMDLHPPVPDRCWIGDDTDGAGDGLCR